jgi:23S rRNA (uracil1939-C5)-methyltransferase
MKRSRGSLPVQKGEIIELSITGMNHQGEGVGKYHGFTVFVPYVVPGDQLKVQVEEVRKNYARGRVVDYLSFSVYHRESKCQSFQECGGCHLQHYSYEEQLNFKREIVENALNRIGGLKEVKVFPTMGMKTPFGYRNKAEYPVRVFDGTFESGFFASGSRSFVPLNRTCKIQHPLVEKTREAFIDICNQQTFKNGFLNAVLHRLVIRLGGYSEEVMVIICSEKPLPKMDLACDCLTSKIPQVKSVYQSIVKKGSSKYLGKRLKLVFGTPFIRERISGLDFDISPGSFFQVNSIQVEVLFSKAVEYANCKGIAVDAYCGTGSISLFLAQKAAKVYGFEVYPGAVKDARHNAEINGIDNVEFVEGDVADTIGFLDGVKPETVVIDPPRAGCEKRGLFSIAGLQPEKIVYVSCNPATLARDLKILADKNYSVTKVQPIDMFPQTYHVECVVLMSRVEK